MDKAKKAAPHVMAFVVLTVGASIVTQLAGLGLETAVALFYLAGVAHPKVASLIAERIK